MIAQEIRQWISDLKLMTNERTPYSYRVAMACFCYNWATDPTKLRTDREHQACRKLAKYAKTYLVSGWWYESSSGRLVPSREYNENYTGWE